MTRTFLALAALLVLSVPTALAAPPADTGKPTHAAGSTSSHSDEKNAAKKCKAERDRIGVQAFQAKYGTNPNKANAFGKCVSAQAKEAETAEAHEARENAAKKCKAERASIGLDSFRMKYGTNPNKANAFGKCVSKLAKQALSS